MTHKSDVINGKVNKETVAGAKSSLSFLKNKYRW